MTISDLFATGDIEVVTPSFVGNNIYNRKSEKYTCYGETDNGWLYKKVG